MDKKNRAAVRKWGRTNVIDQVEVMAAAPAKVAKKPEPKSRSTMC